MRAKRFVPVILCLLAISSLARADAKYLTPDDITASIAVLTPPPADGSPEQKGEIDHLLEIQGKRTPADVERATKHADLSGFTFAEVLGTWFNKTDLPVTAALMTDVASETKAVVSVAKKQFNRQRPFVTDTRVQPAIPEKGFSYPSGHSTAGTVDAAVLAEMFPEHKDELTALGKQVGEDREVAGVHYPSDVEAGRKIGAEIAKRLLANPQFHAELDKAIAEVHADVHAGK
jgi:acid phosphatase (class A)